MAIAALCWGSCDGDPFAEGSAAGPDAEFLGPGLVAEGVGLSAWSEGSPVHLLQPFRCSISFTSSLAGVERPSCLRITKAGHVGAPITVEVSSRVVSDVVGV
jgi:hypothetical protein